jgi:hypothetical protein
MGGAIGGKCRGRQARTIAIDQRPCTRSLLGESGMRSKRAAHVNTIAPEHQGVIAWPKCSGQWEGRWITPSNAVPLADSR